MRTGTLRSLFFLSATLFAIGGCGEDDEPSPAGPGTGGGAGSTGGSGGAGGSTGGSAGSGGSAGATAGSGGGGGTGALAGTPQRPELTETQSASYTILKYLEKVGPVTAPVTDNWDPTAGVGDVAAFTPMHTVAATGGTHTTVQAAIDAAVAAGGTERVYILVSPGTYREMICVLVTAPPITLYSTNADASQTVIVNNNYSSKAKPVGQPANPCNPSASSATYGTSGSATFAAYASNFQAKNITFSNDTDETGLTGVQAVALMTQADKLSFENVRVLGNQDTLYVKTPSVDTISRAYFKSSYVEGDVDFIFGRATFVLDGCEIKYLTARQGSKGGNPLSPSTDARNPYGILVINSTFTAETATPDGTIQLGRAWDESQQNVETYTANVATGVYPNGQALVRQSTLGAHIFGAAPWRSAATTDRPFNSQPGTLPANRLYEYANSGPGSATP